MAALTGQIRVQASPAHVFEYLADITHGPRWIPYVAEARLESTQPGPGAEVALVASVAGRRIQGRGQLNAWEPDQYLELGVVLEDGTVASVEVEIEPAEQGCLVYTTVELQAAATRASARITDLLGERVLRHELQKALRVLKRELDADEVTQ